MDSSIAIYQDELRAITARLHDLANRLVSHSTEQASQRAQLIMAHIRIAQAIRNVQEAERSLGLAEQTTDILALQEAIR